jgi:hypothetical protein
MLRVNSHPTDGVCRYVRHALLSSSGANLVTISLLEIPLRRYLQIPMVDPAICYADQPAPGEPLENLVCLWCSLDFPQHFLGQRQMIA